MKINTSNAKAVACRLSLGRTRHAEARFLWFQDVVRYMCLEVLKMRGDSNPAVSLTQQKVLRKLRSILGPVNIQFVVSARRLPYPCRWCAAGTDANDDPHEDQADMKSDTSKSCSGMRGSRSWYAALLVLGRDPCPNHPLRRGRVEGALQGYAVAPQG